MKLQYLRESSVDLKEMEMESSAELNRPLRCVVKLGGAAITDKNKLETIDEKKLALTCTQLREAFSHSDNLPMVMDWSRHEGSSEFLVPVTSEIHDTQMDAFIVVHGAGSFGHFQASKSGVSKGGLGTALVNAGFVATRISVTRLNLHVVRMLASEGIPVVGISPFSAGWSTHNRYLKTSNVTEVRHIVNSGLVPVLHGDAVLDSGQGCTILSGDVVVRKLAEDLNPSYVVFLTNVPGVFDRPPSEPDAVLLEEIAVDRNGRWTVLKPPNLQMAEVETSTSAHDTTGGMATKIAEAAAIAKSGVDVYIVEVGTEHALNALIGAPLQSGIGKKWVGTLVKSAS